jgi:hypothetical protein
LKHKLQLIELPLKLLSEDLELKQKLQLIEPPLKLLLEDLELKHKSPPRMHLEGQELKLRFKPLELEDSIIHIFDLNNPFYVLLNLHIKISKLI